MISASNDYKNKIMEMIGYCAVSQCFVLFCPLNPAHPVPLHLTGILKPLLSHSDMLCHVYHSG